MKNSSGITYYHIKINLFSAAPISMFRKINRVLLHPPSHLHSISRMRLAGNAICRARHITFYQPALPQHRRPGGTISEIINHFHR